MNHKRDRRRWNLCRPLRGLMNLMVLLYPQLALWATDIFASFAGWLKEVPNYEPKVENRLDGDEINPRAA